MITLSKNSTINLKKDGDNLKKIKVSLNWKTPDNSSTGSMDLDATCFGLIPANNQSKRELFSEEYFIFYNNPKTPNESIVYSGDDKNGDDGEDISVNLSEIPAGIVELAFFVTIHKGKEKKQHFGMVENASISITNTVNGDILATYNLQENFMNETAVHFGSLYRVNEQEWDFKAMGVGYPSALEDILYTYGVNV